MDRTLLIIENVVLGQLAKTVGERGSANLDTKMFLEYEIDSLEALEMILRIETELEAHEVFVDFDREKLHEVLTPRELANKMRALV